MSRLSNLTTIKIGIFKSWNAYWFDKTHYATLLFNDLKIRDYLSGIFYRLRIISDYIYFYRLLNGSTIIKTNLIFFSNLKFKTITLKKVYRLQEQFVFFYKKKTWYRFLDLLTIYYDFLNNISIGNILLLNYSVFTNILISSFFNFSFFLSYFSKLSGLLLTSIHSIYNVNRVVYSSFIRVLQTISTYTSSSISFIFYPVFSLNSLSLLEIDLAYHSIFFLDWFMHTYFDALNMYILLFLKYLIYFFYIYVAPSSNITVLKSEICLNLSLYTQVLIVNDFIFSRFYNTSNVFIPTRRMITQSLFMLFKTQIENTISNFEQQTVYLNLCISFKKNPFIISAKLITDSLVYLLQAGKKIVQSFFFIRNWQASLYASRRRLEYKYYKHVGKYITSLNYLFLYATKRSPVIGIRIECSGTFKKGRMSRVYFYSSWIKNDLLTGKMPNNTVIADIDYYQYFAITKGSSIGIKTWIFLETHIYNNNHKYISIVY